MGWDLSFKFVPNMSFILVFVKDSCLDGNFGLVMYNNVEDMNLDGVFFFLIKKGGW